MDEVTIVFIVLFGWTALTVIDAFLIDYYKKQTEYWRRESRMLRRLLSEQAELHRMSLDAYIAMLQTAQRRSGDQQITGR